MPLPLEKMTRSLGDNNLWYCNESVHRKATTKSSETNYYNLNKPRLRSKCLLLLLLLLLLFCFLIICLFILTMGERNQVKTKFTPMETFSEKFHGTAFAIVIQVITLQRAN